MYRGWGDSNSVEGMEDPLRNAQDGRGSSGDAPAGEQAPLGEPSGAQYRLAKTGLAVSVIALAAVIGLVLSLRADPRPGPSFLLFAAATALAGLIASAQRIQREAPFRVVCAAAAGILIGVGGFLFSIGGWLLWPGAVVLAGAALMSQRLSLGRGVMLGALASGLLLLAVTMSHAVYTCAKPQPILETSFSSRADAVTVMRMLEGMSGVTSVRLVAGTPEEEGRYRVKFERGAAGERDGAAAALRSSGAARSISVDGRRCETEAFLQ
jgi:hypothetical protein